MMARFHIFLIFLVIFWIPTLQRPLRHPAYQGTPKRLARLPACQSRILCRHQRSQKSKRRLARYHARQSSPQRSKRHPGQQSRRDYRRQHFRFGKGLKNIAKRKGNIRKEKYQKKNLKNQSGGQNPKRKIIKGRKGKRPRNIASKKFSGPKKQLMKDHVRVRKAKRKVKKTRKNYCNNRAKKCCFEAKDGRNRVKIKERKQRIRYCDKRKPRSDNDLEKGQRGFLERSTFGEQHELDNLIMINCYFALANWFV